MNSLFRPTVPAFCSILTALALSSAPSARAYPVGPPRSLGEMTATADLVVKAKVISSAKAKGDTNVMQGFAMFETKLQVISTLKGEPGGSVITFRHYSEYNMDGITYAPQHYEFTKGQSYIVFAKRANAPAGFESLWWNESLKGDEGVIRAPDDSPLTANTVQDACWQNLVACCNSTKSELAVYGIEQMDSMSTTGGSWMYLHDFPRDKVIEVIRPLLASSDTNILQAVIKFSGSRGPYMGDLLYEAPLWLAARYRLPDNFVSRDLNMSNPAGQALWHELVSVADGRARPEIRAQAICALGRTCLPELPALIDKWLADPQPAIRQAAVLLLSDFPGEHSQGLVLAASKDPKPVVRESAALAIAFGKYDGLIPRLRELAKDGSPEVVKAVEVALESLPLEKR